MAIKGEGSTPFTTDFDLMIKRPDLKSLTASLQHIGIITDLMNSQIFKSKIIYVDFIIVLS